jgi:flagellar assembly protein FliH
MSAQVSIAPGEVLRGIRIDGPPLRLGRTKASAGAAAEAGISTRSEDEVLCERRAVALREGREEGLRCGRAEGLREGRAQAADEIRQAVQRALAEAEREQEAALQRLQRLAQQAEDRVAEIVAAAHDEIAALCYETLCRIVGSQALRPEFVLAQVAELVQQHGSVQMVLHVHPQDAELLQQQAGAADLKWMADPDVALGGCVLHSSGGGLDGRLETILAACKSALLDARAQAVSRRAARART